MATYRTGGGFGGEPTNGAQPLSLFNPANLAALTQAIKLLGADKQRTRDTLYRSPTSGESIVSMFQNLGKRNYPDVDPLASPPPPELYGPPAPPAKSETIGMKIRNMFPDKESLPGWRALLGTYLVNPEPKDKIAGKIDPISLDKVAPPLAGAATLAAAAQSTGASPAPVPATEKQQAALGVTGRNKPKWQKQALEQTAAAPLEDNEQLLRDMIKANMAQQYSAPVDPQAEEFYRNLLSGNAGAGERGNALSNALLAAGGAMLKSGMRRNWQGGGIGEGIEKGLEMYHESLNQQQNRRLRDIAAQGAGAQGLQTIAGLKDSTLRDQAQRQLAGAEALYGLDTSQAASAFDQWYKQQLLGINQMKANALWQRAANAGASAKYPPAHAYIDQLVLYGQSLPENSPERAAVEQRLKAIQTANANPLFQPAGYGGGLGGISEDSDPVLSAEAAAFLAGD